MQLRPARPEDRDAVAGVHVRSWQAAYRGLLPDDYLDGLDPASRAARYTFGSADPRSPHTTLAVADGSVIGFASVAPSGDDDRPGCGELCALYVDPTHWGSGAGRALITDARARLGAAGFDRAVLWVMVGNEPAMRFYRADGWTPDGARRTATVHGATVDEVRWARALPG